MTVTVACSMCHVEYEPTSDEILAGVWRTCAGYRADGAPGGRPDREMELIAAGAHAHAAPREEQR